MNIVIPILIPEKDSKLYYGAHTSSGCQLHKTARQLYIVTCQQDILSQIYDVIQSDARALECSVYIIITRNINCTSYGAMQHRFHI